MVLVAALSLPLGISGCCSLLGYSFGRMIDQGAAHATPPPKCGTHTLHEGQKIRVRLSDGTKRTGLYMWHDCEGDSLLVMRTEVSSFDMAGVRPDTLRIPLRTIQEVKVPREAARYVGLVIGAGFDFLIWGMVLTSVQGGWGLE
jgi:hypothetical protein